MIGNSTYKESPLPNPSNDARAMATKLRELGFAVIEKQNATREDMAAASREFGNRLKVGGVGLFYYAGHGVQLNGLNYLLPVDADIQDETELQTRGYDVNEILNKMDAAKNPLNIVILDACRNNPLPRSTRAVARGLATMQQGTGTIVAYATQPGATAADGPAGGNSLYTQQLLQALAQPGLKIEDVFKQVRTEVFRLSSGTQTPWENSSLVGEFYFNRTPGGQPGQTDAGALARMPVPNLAEPRSLSSGTRNFQPKPGAGPAATPRYIPAVLERPHAGSHGAVAVLTRWQQIRPGDQGPPAASLGHHVQQQPVQSRWFRHPDGLIRRSRHRRHCRRRVGQHPGLEYHSACRTHLQRHERSAGCDRGESAALARREPNRGSEPL
ncbi:MAG: caspase family protein [Gammaproteobacteria bacterium]|nr:caspase family protein [Gammaproteobacteria bacterium]